MNRRQVLLAGLGLLGLWQFAARAVTMRDNGALDSTLSSASGALQDRNGDEPQGRLVIIGGAEDRSGDMLILRRFIELAANKGRDPQIAVITAASAYPDFVWGRYDQVLTELGAARRVYIGINTRDDCSDPQWAARIRESDGVLLTGGDQRRLVGLIGGTEVAQAIDHVYRAEGACVAGTSAGAAAMSHDMLAGRAISDGIGLLRGALIDQHFSERRRLNRLISAVARNPSLIGIGVDENTALIISHGKEFEVIGAGGVTIVDGRRLSQPIEDAEPEQLLQMPELQVLRLPRDALYRQGEAEGDHKLLPEERSALQALWEMLPELTR